MRKRNLFFGLFLLSMVYIIVRLLSDNWMLLTPSIADVLVIFTALIAIFRLVRYSKAHRDG